LGQVAGLQHSFRFNAVVLYAADQPIPFQMRPARWRIAGSSRIFNAAAYTAVDKAETPDGSRVAAWQVNVAGIANLARVAREQDLTLVPVSSEYVFDGRHPGPIREDTPPAERVRSVEGRRRCRRGARTEAARFLAQAPTEDA
jgi:nucleoside-diphosphate-sugar epimerase